MNINLISALFWISVVTCPTLPCLAQTKPAARKPAAAAPTGPTLKTYSGAYGDKDDGKATYTYYIDAATGGRVKHGAFAYTRDYLWSGYGSANMSGTRLVDKESGRYEHGRRVGSWNWTHSQYGSLSVNLFYGKINDQTARLDSRETTTVTFGAEGRPFGPCSYTNVNYSGGKAKPASETATGTLSGDFFTGTFTYHYRDPLNPGTQDKRLTARFSDDGLAHGPWKITYYQEEGYSSRFLGPVTETRTYRHGVLKSRRTLQESTGSILDNYEAPATDTTAGLAIKLDTVHLSSDPASELPAGLGPNLLGSGGGAFGAFEQWGFAWAVRPTSATMVFSHADTLLLNAGAELLAQSSRQLKEIRAMVVPGPPSTESVLNQRSRPRENYAEREARQNQEQKERQAREQAERAWHRVTKEAATGESSSSYFHSNAPALADSTWVPHVRQLSRTALAVWKSRQRLLGLDDKTPHDHAQASMWDSDSPLLNGDATPAATPSALEASVDKVKRQINARQELREALTEARPAVEAAHRYLASGYMLDTLSRERAAYLTTVAQSRTNLLATLRGLNLSVPDFSKSVTEQEALESRADSAMRWLVTARTLRTIDPHCRTLRQAMRAFNDRYTPLLTQETQVANELKAASEDIQAAGILTPLPSESDALGIATAAQQTLTAHYKSAIAVCENYSTPVSERQTQAASLRAAAAQAKPLYLGLLALNRRHRDVVEYYKTGVRPPNSPIPYDVASPPVNGTGNVYGKTTSTHYGPVTLNSAIADPVGALFKAAEGNPLRRRVWAPVEEKLLQPTYAAIRQQPAVREALQLLARAERTLERMIEIHDLPPAGLEKRLRKAETPAQVSEALDLKP